MLVTQNRMDEAITALFCVSDKAYTPTIHYLARMYLTGKGVGKKFVLGIKMFNRAA